jgi:hypothetical protein
MRNIEINFSFDEMVQELAEAGFDIVISTKTASSKTGTIKINFSPEYEAECNECNGCACETPQEAPNPFIVQHEQERANMAKLGLSDFPYHEQHKIISEAKKHISEHNITDEDEKVKVHYRMRDYYLAYKEHVKNGERQ